MTVDIPRRWGIRRAIGDVKGWGWERMGGFLDIHADALLTPQSTHDASAKSTEYTAIVP